MVTRKDDLPEFPEDKVVESGLGEYVDVLRKAHALCNECNASGLAVFIVLDAPVATGARMVLSMGHDIGVSPALRACKEVVDFACHSGEASTGKGKHAH
jgi:hypothetical protein